MATTLNGNRPKTCRYCGEKGHELSVCPRIQCLNCQQYGHIDSDCTAVRKCLNCGLSGHKVRDCPTILERDCTKRGHIPDVCKHLPEYCSYCHRHIGHRYGTCDNPKIRCKNCGCQGHGNEICPEKEGKRMGYSISNSREERERRPTSFIPRGRREPQQRPSSVRVHVQKVQPPPLSLPTQNMFELLEEEIKSNKPIRKEPETGLSQNENEKEEKSPQIKAKKVTWKQGSIATIVALVLYRGTKEDKDRESVSEPLEPMKEKLEKKSVDLDSLNEFPSTIQSGNTSPSRQPQAKVSYRDAAATIAIPKLGQSPDLGHNKTGILNPVPSPKSACFMGRNKDQQFEIRFEDEPEFDDIQSLHSVQSEEWFHETGEESDDEM